MNLIDAFLNRITMYRLVTYGLGIIVAVSVAFSLIGRLSFSPTSLILSLAVICVSAYLGNVVFRTIWKVPTNLETWLITALILFLIMRPATTTVGFVSLALAGFISSASKFLIAWRGKHVFNPAALGAAVIGIAGGTGAAWWVGSSTLWPVTLIIGLLFVRKIRRFPLVMTFAAVAIVTEVIDFMAHGYPVWSSLQSALISSPLIFLGTVMLTEPATMPPRRGQQMAFGAIVAVLYATAFQIGPLPIYPEVALLIGNFFAYLITPTQRVKLQLKEIRRVSSRVSDYVFTPASKFRFLPGQYMEWTLAGVPYDTRGNRRSFTIASSPTEPEVHLGLKFYEPASTFKATMAAMKPGDAIYVSQLAGNFTLPKQPGRKLAFVAGGIGVTPFRSMVKYVSDMNISSDIVVLYVVADPAELAYADIFAEARRVGVRYIPLVSNPKLATENVRYGQLDKNTISALVPDAAERTFYISGPNAMVEATKKTLHKLDIGGTQIKTDHFSGY